MDHPAHLPDYDQSLHVVEQINKKLRRKTGDKHFVYLAHTGDRMAIILNAGEHVLYDNQRANNRKPDIDQVRQALREYAQRILRGVS